MLRISSFKDDVIFAHNGLMLFAILETFILLSISLLLCGDAENARHEIAGHENAAPECKGGKCET